jgi:UDP-3-O-[3-hydroxymyristoyl] glucosamine N-acyltransferase
MFLKKQNRRRNQIYPHVYIGKGVKIGKNCKIDSGARIYDYCIIGDNCVIHSNTVIGGDGFGFQPTRMDSKNSAVRKCYH